jgi:hypothetical protein
MTNRDISKDDIVKQSNRTTAIARIEPKAPPVLIEEWVVWEFDTLVHTNGIDFRTEDLHDLLKKDLGEQGTPVNIFLSPDARWIIEGARARIKFEKDFRSRVVATLKDSPYTDIQFIAGIDYFGDSSWANIQMMLVVQPESISLPPRPSAPKKKTAQPLLPTEAIVVMALLAGGLLFTGNSALQFLGCIGIIGTVVLFGISQKDVNEAASANALADSRYESEVDRWREEKVEIELEQEELKKHRLSRCFKRDDLRVFHSVMIKSTAKIITDEIFNKGATIAEESEDTDESSPIPSMKDKLFSKAAKFEG